MITAARGSVPTRPTLAQRREALAKLMQLSDCSAPMRRIDERTLATAEGPLRLRVYTPQAAETARTAAIVYFHGGGFVAGSLDTHDGLCRSLAHETGAKLLAVAYRLAPEHSFPAAVNDACAATLAIGEGAGELGIDAQRLAVAGDSAGACLAAVVAREMRGRSGVRLAAQLLLCPITDFAGETPSRREFADGYVIDRETIESDLDYYLCGADPSDPRVSPLRAADLDGLPPALVHTAEFDPMRDEGAAYARRLVSYGVPVRHTCHPGMIHLFYAMSGMVPYARAALRGIGEEMRAAFASPVLS